MTNARTYSTEFENKDIINVMKALDPCKAHGYDDVSIKKLKICDSDIVKPPAILLKILSVKAYFQITSKNQISVPFTKRW